MDEKKVREAIKYFKIMLFDMEGMGFKYIPKYYETAIEALEKQLPKKAKENEIRGGWLGKQKHYTCPTCGNCLLTEMMNERQNTSYCWDCGQKLDWSE